MFKSNKYTILGFVLGVAFMASLAASWTPSGGNRGVYGGVTNQVSYATNIVSTTSNTVAVAAAESSGGPEVRRIRVMQNIGTVPVLYCFGGTASTTNLHGILAPGTVARDGFGSMLDLTDWRGSIGIAVESGTGVVVTCELISGTPQ